MNDILNLTKDAPLLDLTKAAPTLKTLRARVTWSMHPVHGASLTQGFDLDLLNYVLNASEKISGGSDVVFFNNRVYNGGAIKLLQDERVGGKEECDYTLSDIPADRAHIDIYVSVFEAAQRAQHFGMMSGARLTLEADGQLVQAYAISDYTGMTMLHAGRLSRTAAGWTFQPIGEAAVASPNDVARACL